MPLIWADAMLQQVRQYRSVWLGGRVGGGKTSLAFKIAASLVDDGHANYILSNIPCVFADDLARVARNIEDGQYLNTVIIADEGGIFMKRSREAAHFNAFMRKFNTYLLVPSVEPPSSALKKFQIMRLFSLSPAGIPLWIYRVRINVSGANQQHYFGWWKPSEVYGVYDTQAVPLDFDDVGDFLTAHVDVVSRLTTQTRRSYRDLVSGVSGFVSPTAFTSSVPSFQSEAMDNMLDDMEDVLEPVADSIIDVSHDIQYSGKRRRRRG